MGTLREAREKQLDTEKDPIGLASCSSTEGALGIVAVLVPNPVQWREMK
jgi:hypothetical protein